jgi:putative ABC transport system permease protein
VLTQFLVEAVTLSLIGGAMGILLGIGLAYAVPYVPFLADSKIVLKWESIVLAFGFAAGIGIFFGFYPARKAAGLNPIEALRYE